MDPEDETEEGALASAMPSMNVGDWARSMQGLTAEQSAYSKQRESERAAQYEAARKALEEKRFGPSRAEELFALSAAIGTPMVRPSFGGVMSNVSSALANIERANREAQISRADALAALQQEYMTGNDAAKMAEFKARGEALGRMGPVLARAAAPRVARPVGTQVINGKIVAISQDPTTGEFTQTELGDAPTNLKPMPGVTSGSQPVFVGANGPVDATGRPVTTFDTKPKPISATEQRQMVGSEDLINSGIAAVKNLEDALGLNKQAYEGSLSGWRKTVGALFSSDDPRYVATEQFDNLATGSALDSLKTTFGGNPTEGERKILLELQAVSTKPRAVREAILRRAMEAVKIRIRNETQRLQRFKSGEYSTRGGSTAGVSRVIRYDKNGNRL